MIGICPPNHECARHVTSAKRARAYFTSATMSVEQQSIHGDEHSVPAKNVDRRPDQSLSWSSQILEIRARQAPSTSYSLVPFLAISVLTMLSLPRNTLHSPPYYHRSYAAPASKPSLCYPSCSVRSSPCLLYPGLLLLSIPYIMPLIYLSLQENV